MRISLGHNNVPEDALSLIAKVWKSGQFSPGPMVREFEEKFALLHKARHAVFVNSGTDALRLSLLAMKEKYGWKDGDRVAVPALTFVATVNVIIQSGLTPFFVDVGMNDFNINPHNLSRRLGEFADNVRAVIPVHLFGKSCGNDLFKVAETHNLKVLEDSCETILNPLRGIVSCYSTYMAHHVTTGVGGFAVTNDNAMNHIIRSYANHGRNVAYLPGYKSLGLGKDLLSKRFRFDRIGYSSRGTEFEAALGIPQLGLLRAAVEKRRGIYTDIFHALSGFSDFRFLGDEDNTCMMFPIVIYEDSKVKKYDLCLFLEKNGIETRDMMPITSQPCYKEFLNEEDFPVAGWINKNGFYIACHNGVTPKDVSLIRSVFTKYFSQRH